MNGILVMERYLLTIQEKKERLIDLKMESGTSIVVQYLDLMVI